jgi:hypothetical protein
MQDHINFMHEQANELDIKHDGEKKPALVSKPVV